MDDKKLLTMIKWAIDEQVCFVMTFEGDAHINTDDIERLEKLYDKQFEVNENTLVDTKVYVSNDGECWDSRHFKCMNNGRYICFVDGKTSFTTEFAHTWKYCKLAK